MMLKVFISQVLAVKRSLYQNIVIFNRAIRPLQYWSIFPLISCGPKEARSKCIGHPVTVSKGESLRVPKVVNLRFRKTNGSAFAQGVSRVSTDCAESY